jgi:hypothetical protein
MGNCAISDFEMSFASKTIAWLTVVIILVKTVRQDWNWSTVSLMYHSIGKLGSRPITLLVCDMQEQFQPLIHNMETVVNTCKYMINVATALDIPIVVTQQNTKVFGPIIADIFPSSEIQNNTKVYEKEII